MAGDHTFTLELLLWIHLVLLLIHQFEEYIYPGGFQSFYNAHIYGKSPFTRSKLSKSGVIIVNILVAWPAYLVSAIYASEMIWLAVGLSFVSIVNGALHTFMFIKLKKYNPGLISGLFGFIPFGVYLLLRLFQTKAITVQLSVFVLIIALVTVPFLIYLTSVSKK